MPLSETSAALFNLILESDNRYNLHSHTEFCDGRASARLMTEAAVKAGMRLFGHTPHSPVPVESGCNMLRRDVDVYIAEVRGLAERFDSEMRVLAGMEIDYLSHEWGPHIDYFLKMPLDYRIGSVHFIPSLSGMPVDIDGSHERFEKNMKKHFGNDLRYVAEKYFEQVIRMIEDGGFEVLGHLDKVAHNVAASEPGIEEEGWYAAMVEDVVNHAADAGMPVEINTKSYQRNGRFFPARRWWDMLKEKGCSIVVNSDSHYPDLINAGRQEALALLDPDFASEE